MASDPRNFAQTLSIEAGEQLTQLINVTGGREAAFYTDENGKHWISVELLSNVTTSASMAFAITKTPLATGAKMLYLLGNIIGEAKGVSLTEKLGQFGS